MELRLGDMLGSRYRLLELIGRGGMGSVYQARDEVLWRDVALKIFDASVLQKDVQRQEDEINVLGSLNHHGLVTLLDASIDRTDPEDPRIYFAMELVQGTDLERRLKAGPMSRREIAYVGFDIAEALQYIHHRGVVHRDVKPSNVLMVDYRSESPRARAKLTDFGIALVGTGSRVTLEGITTGTAAYLSPEQVARREVGAPSDIYSLGLVLLECFTRELAFDGEPVQSAVARLSNDPGIPSTVPNDWRDLLAAMTAREPADRPDSAELVQLFKQAVIAESGRHRSPRPTPEAIDLARITAIAAKVAGVAYGRVTIVDEFSGLLPLPPHRGESLDLVASVPLLSRDGRALGALELHDARPSRPDSSQLAILEDLAELIRDELELRLARTRTRVDDTRDEP